MFIEACLNLAWSHWVGLGVRGTAPPPDTAVDPEALLYFTACIAPYDPRLRDEVGDWWKQFHRYISRPRLTALGGKFDESVVLKFRDLETSFDALKITSGKSRLDRLDIPARTLLRFRCAFGASARAEILFELLTRRSQAPEGMTALALSEIGYSKRNVAFVLDDLVLAGILASTKEGNRRRFRVADPGALESFLRPLPAGSGRWHMRLPVIASFVELSKRLRGRDALVQGIEARKLLTQMMPRIQVTGASGAMPTATAETYWDELQPWLIDSLIADDSDTRHRIPRMLEGVWIGPNESAKIRRPERFTSAVLPNMSADPTSDSELR
ncbi:MAG TPA: winged helix-turn-helix domain-containing protein, partial [Kofleriaceae bacterium]